MAADPTLSSTNATVKAEIYELSIRELQARFNLINTIHDQLRVRVLAFLTVIIAFATYIFTDDTLVPAENYGSFLLGLGTLLLVGIFGTMLRLISSGEWELPVEIKEIERADVLYSSKEEYLKYIQTDYITAIQGNNSRVMRNGRLFNQSIYVFTFTAIILLAIKGG